MPAQAHQADISATSVMSFERASASTAPFEEELEVEAEREEVVSPRSTMTLRCLGRRVSLRMSLWISSGVRW